MNEQNASMDEILSSIRDIVKEEAGSDDAQATPTEKKEAAPAADSAPTTPPEDANANDADIDAMMAAAQEEGTTEAAAEATDEAEDDVLELTETVDESNTQASETTPDETLAEEPAPVADPVAQESKEDVSVAPATTKADSAPTDPVPAEETKPTAQVAPGSTNEQVFLNAMPSAKGLQLAFPVEVLAEALRPLVKDWVSQNLPDIVERLVREELSRLVDKK